VRQLLGHHGELLGYRLGRRHAERGPERHGVRHR
jgi:hypothetical protein